MHCHAVLPRAPINSFLNGTMMSFALQVIPRGFPIQTLHRTKILGTYFYICSCHDSAFQKPSDPLTVPLQLAEVTSDMWWIIINQSINGATNLLRGDKVLNVQAGNFIFQVKHTGSEFVQCRGITLSVRPILHKLTSSACRKDAECGNVWNWNFTCRSLLRWVKL